MVDKSRAPRSIGHLFLRQCRRRPDPSPKRAPVLDDQMASGDGVIGERHVARSKNVRVTGPHMGIDSDPVLRYSLTGVDRQSCFRVDPAGDENEITLRCRAIREANHPAPLNLLHLDTEAEDHPFLL